MNDLDTWEWFGNRTFHHSQFEPLAKLRAAKERLGLSVSVCLPTRDEAATVGGIVRNLRRNLHERARLVDEIVVMDAGSRDDTVAIARAEGAKVFFEHEVLPGEGPGSGKGEALWKSLHACEGDLICWVDADIRNFPARFVYGLLGPLLLDPDIQYVKAFYDRPIRERNALRATGGGRVTELLARPLINLLWPELAGIVQPLSGEYAGRRETLEQVPFFSGYGVELGLLVDIAARFGVDAIAQVDLDRRVHRNQDMQALGRMSFGILQAAFLRLAEEGRSVPGNFATTLVQFSNELVEYQPEPREIVTSRRPPIVTVDDYRRRRADPVAASE
ncbi:MAG TPA: glucosyl-3-phosphoglycerate synthase [Actinomycetota bacterium]|nr:glucosyl-3-phosphoglycerate synthase [Actinomycetota bacterium]